MTLYIQIKQSDKFNLYINYTEANNSVTVFIEYPDENALNITKQANENKLEMK